MEGRTVQLTSISLSALSVPECIALQRVAQTRLKQLGFKSHVTIPKGKVQQCRYNNIAVILFKVLLITVNPIHLKTVRMRLSIQTERVDTRIKNNQGN